MYLRPAHEYLGWWQLRQQLGAARSSTALGDIPLIAAVAAELGSLDDATQATGHAPFEQDAHPTFGSLVDDLRRAHAMLGQELQSITKGVIKAVDALGSYTKCTQPPWEELIEATRPLRRALLLGSAVVAGFDDALEAARKVSDPGGYDRLGRRLNELRFLSEHQGRGWKSVSGAIDEHFSVASDD